jgi:hypothetical protein
MTPIRTRSKEPAAAAFRPKSTPVAAAPNAAFLRKSRRVLAGIELISSYPYKKNLVKQLPNLYGTSLSQDLQNNSKGHALPIELTLVANQREDAEYVSLRWTAFWRTFRQRLFHCIYRKMKNAAGGITS